MMLSLKLGTASVPQYRSTQYAPKPFHQPIIVLILVTPVFESVSVSHGACLLVTYVLRYLTSQVQRLHSPPSVFGQFKMRVGLVLFLVDWLVFRNSCHGSLITCQDHRDMTLVKQSNTNLLPDPWKKGCIQCTVHLISTIRNPALKDLLSPYNVQYKLLRTIQQSALGMAQSTKIRLISRWF